jgi:predicted metal-dependent peptidase
MLRFKTSFVTFVLNWNFQHYYTLQFQSIQSYTLLFNTAEKHISFRSILTFGWYLSWIPYILQNVCLLGFSAAKNAISHHTFHIQYNHMEKRKATKRLSLFKHAHNIAKAINSSVMSVCLPICLFAKKDLVPTGWILWNLMYEYFSKTCWENSLFLKI